MAALYVDRSKAGLYSVRLVLASDPGIAKGNPLTSYMMPVQSRYDTPQRAAQQARARLGTLGFGKHASRMKVWVEQEDGGVRRL